MTYDVNPKQLRALREALADEWGRINCWTRTGQALARRGLAEQRGVWFLLTPAGRARARYAADVEAQNEHPLRDPSVMEDLP